MRPHTLAIFLLPAISVSAPAQFTLTAPATVKAGSSVQIGYSGATDKRDFVTIVSPDTAKGKYTGYKYLSSGNPVELRAPEAPGAYEVRLLDGVSGYPTLATRPIVVEAVQVSLDAPSQVDAGADVQINWQGPNNQQDFVTIVPVSTPEKKYEAYKYTKSGNPVTIRAPETAGDYEIRYLSGSGYLTWASRSLTVGSVSAALEASPQVAAGGSLQIKWSGPNNDRDFITIVPAGSPERKYSRYRYTSSGNPVELAVPDEPGQYEVRYLTGGDYLTLASHKLTVGEVSASVDGPDEVQGGASFELTWTGPDNPRDFVTIVEQSRPEREYGAYAYTGRGSPLTLRAPLEPGDYELRYSMGASYRTLASKPIRVTPPATQPGSLRVVPADAVSGAAASPAAGAIEVILDASGSMLQRQDGERRIDIAKRTLTKLTAETIPAGTPFALRVFGHKQADSCRTDLEIPMKPLDPAAAAMIAGIQAMNLAKTPIADSLAKTAQDLSAAKGERTVVLVTDGEETCGGDPAAAIEQLKKAGVDVRVNIVGFAIDDADLKGQFRYWANVGGGEYFDAAGAAELAGQLTQALRAPFEVVNAGGEVVAEGIVGGDAVEVPAGVYSLRTKGDRKQSAVEVKPGQETVANL